MRRCPSAASLCAIEREDRLCGTVGLVAPEGAAHGVKEIQIVAVMVAIATHKVNVFLTFFIFTCYCSPPTILNKFPRNRASTKGPY